MSNIILIDDCAFSLAITKYTIETLGHQVHTFQKPLDALEAIPKLNPDIVITDYLMFDTDGIEVINKLRLLDVKAEFILLTSFGDEMKPICKEKTIRLFDKKDQMDELMEYLKCL